MIYVIIAAILLSALLLSRRASAECGATGYAEVKCAGGKPSKAQYVDLGYEHFTHLSIRDTAAALSGTRAAFDVTNDGVSLSITRGNSYAGAAGEPLTLKDGYDTRRLPVFIDGRETRYYAVIVKGVDDAFFLPCDLALLLGMDVRLENGAYTVDPDREFVPDPEKMCADGYFEDMNAVLAGDADTGEVFCGFNAETPFAIASTTKLMTFLLTLDEISAGKLNYNDTVTVTKEAQALAENGDGTVPLRAGQTPTVLELLQALMLPSSNECAYLLAQYVAGSEEKFVVRMNEKARELGMATARYYNAHGLPSFTHSIIPAKRSNHCSAKDMFTLACHLLKTHPEATDITSLKSAYLPTFDVTVTNTNVMLWNVPGAVGLKTGTTNRAGCCLVTAVKVGGRTAVTVLLGAEDSAWRVRCSELLLAYARGRLKSFCGKI